MKRTIQPKQTGKDNQQRVEKMKQPVQIIACQKAFILYCRKHEKLKDDSSVQKILRLAKNEHGSEISGVSLSTIRRLFPKNPDNRDSADYPIEDEEQIKRFFSYIRLLTEKIGHPIEWTKEKIGWIQEREEFDTPRLLNGEFVEMPLQTYKLFYWSKRNKTINEGQLVLNESTFEAKMNKPFRSETKAEIGQLIGTYEKSINTFYINLRRDSPLGKIVSQIIFESSDTGKNVFLGTFCTATYSKHQPYAGVVVLVKNDTPVTEDLRNMIVYLLFHKRYQPKVQNFHSANLTQGPAEVKMWSKINRELYGVYQGFFANPFIDRFEAFILHINKNGLVDIYVSALIDKAVKFYRGIVRTGEEKITFSTRLIVEADYLPAFLEYRVRLYLDTYNFSRDTSNLIKGIYTCLRLDDGKPFASKMTLRRISDEMDSVDLKQFVYNKTVTSENEFAGLKKLMTEEHIDKFFFDSHNKFLKQFAIDMF